MSGEFLQSEARLQGPRRYVWICLNVIAVLWCLCMPIFYVVYLFKTDRVPVEQKALWATVIILGHMLAMPVFWYLHVWREPKKE
jgi:hypothetical protein